MNVMLVSRSFENRYTKVLILSVDETEKYVSLAGASGYILKNTSPINTQIIEPKPWERFEMPLQKLTKI